MTSFAREDSKQEIGVFTWELRSVNHRYLEAFLRLPDEFRKLESEIRLRLKSKLHRGKVECALTYKPSMEINDISLNEAMVDQLNQCIGLVEDKVSKVRPISPMEIIRWPGILETNEVDIELVSNFALDLLDKTIDDLVEARLREGEKLSHAIVERLNEIDKIVNQVKVRIPDVLTMAKDRLNNRFEELQLQLDADRLEQEMVLIIQKADVEEELKRLETHINEVRRIVTESDGKPVGRRLDFLMQELNREANTLCSKSMDTETTKAGIDLKVYIEQMREQIQNIE